MKSRPHFEVKLIKGNKVTRFACSYIQDVGEQVEDAPSKWKIANLKKRKSKLQYLQILYAS